MITAVAAKKGIDKLATLHPDIDITVGTIDPKLTDDGVVFPGIGDAGDRLFGTSTMEDDEELMHPSKRRKNSIDE